MAANVRSFGATADGRPVQAIDLTSSQLRATILTFGATLQDLRLVGTPWPLTLGGQDIAAYEGPMRYFGAIVGPVANRIAGARVIFNDQVLNFHANEHGRTSLHGGATGTGQKVWDISDVTEISVELTLDLSDGEGGYPGNRRINAVFRLDGPTLALDMSAITDAPTLINLANHSYWNLDGAMDTAGQVLTVTAATYTTVDADLIPVGPPTDVVGTDFDLRHGRALDRVSRYDHNFCTAKSQQNLRDVAWLRGTKGVTMAIATTAPGLQVYDGARMNSQGALGHTGQSYGAFGGIALETQCWPDAPNRPDFPSVALEPGQIYDHKLRLTFSRSDA